MRKQRNIGCGSTIKLVPYAKKRRFNTLKIPETMGGSDNYDLVLLAHHLNNEGSILFTNVFIENVKLRCMRR